MRIATILATLALAASGLSAAAGDAGSRPPGADLRQPVLWGAECLEPEGSGLAFGGCEQAAADGRQHTKVREGGAWKPIVDELRAKNPLQKHFDRTWDLRCRTKNAAARARAIWFKGLDAAEEAKRLKAEAVPLVEAVAKDLDALVAELGGLKLEEYEAAQAKLALALVQSAAGKIKPLAGALAGGVTADQIKTLSAAQVELERASEALDCEPPARALSPIAYDAKTKLYVLFGGDHLDYLTADTWAFDPAKKKWMQRHPASAPSPRANHRLKAADGKATLSGGYAYTSTTDYCGGQYKDVGDGEWVYDIAADTWTASGGGKPGTSDARAYRTGRLHPDLYLSGEKPNAAAFEEKLKALPVNTWVLPNPPHKPALNRDWGTAVIDPDRDMILRWSGGHSAHGGSDVPHYHFSTNRWELAFPIEFPLGQLYSNTSYPDTFNFNLRPWVTGHTYLGYDYDPVAKKMLFVGHGRNCYVYDPDLADWTGRFVKPGGMIYDGCFYNLNCCRTPQGIVCWGANAKVHRFDAAKNQWTELKVTGKLPGASVDNSVSVYDSKRDRLLIFCTGYGAPYSGQVWALDLKTLAAAELSPVNMAVVPGGPRFGIDRAVYDPEADLVLMATLLPAGADGVGRTPAYDCATNKWVALKIGYQTAGDKKSALVPLGHSCGVMYDVRRKLVWGVDTNSNVFVLRLDAKAADAAELK
ncbi:MAG TPA: kelch repeat-containing protein [Planctomycetota bacterium]|nr:kelch repeat-containing protein [Planctomycetota bacterium]